MENNGSPPPRLSPDDGQTNFLVELPAHHKLKGGRTDKVTTQVTGEVARLAWPAVPLIGCTSKMGDEAVARS
jgi:hypothetical protein